MPQPLFLTIVNLCLLAASESAASKKKIENRKIAKVGKMQ